MNRLHGRLCGLYYVVFLARKREPTKATKSVLTQPPPASIALARRVASLRGMDMRGFTLVELVVVIVLLGILVAYAAPRFAGRGGYSELTAREDVKQSLRYAQQLAMSQTNSTVTFSSPSSTQIDVQVNGVSAPLPGAPPPGGGNTFPKSMQAGITLNGIASPLTFDRFGATSNATISVIGSLRTLKICVVGTTGYAYDC